VNRMSKLFLALACALVSATAAPAHSILLESTPGPGASVRAPAAVALRFNNRIEKPLSRLRLVGPEGRAVPLPVDPGGDADRLTAVAPPISAGKYHVEWQVLSSDGHVVTGRFSFTVVP
jgi:methionine-rich copper-binding protein CopC